MEDCLFCKIVDGRIPGAIVYQDAQVVAFKDINPQAPTHLLVVPVGALVRTGAALAREHGHGERGYRALFNTNADAGQTVFHIHLHVLGGRTLTWPPG